MKDRQVNLLTRLLVGLTLAAGIQRAAVHAESPASNLVPELSVCSLPTDDPNIKLYRVDRERIINNGSNSVGPIYPLLYVNHLNGPYRIANLNPGQTHIGPHEGRSFPLWIDINRAGLNVNAAIDDYRIRISWISPIPDCHPSSSNQAIDNRRLFLPYLPKNEPAR